MNRILGPTPDSRRAQEYPQQAITSFRFKDGMKFVNILGGQATAFMLKTFIACNTVDDHAFPAETCMS